MHHILTLTQTQCAPDEFFTPESVLTFFLRLTKPLTPCTRLLSSYKYKFISQPNFSTSVIFKKRCSFFASRTVVSEGCDEHSFFLNLQWRLSEAEKLGCKMKMMVLLPSVTFHGTNNNNNNNNTALFVPLIDKSHQFMLQSLDRYLIPWQPTGHLNCEEDIEKEDVDNSNDLAKNLDWKWVNTDQLSR